MMQSPLDPRGEQARIPTSVPAAIIHPSLQRTPALPYYRMQFERTNRAAGIGLEMEGHGRVWRIHLGTGFVRACRSHYGDAHILVCLSSVSPSSYEPPDGLVMSTHFTCQDVERDKDIQRRTSYPQCGNWDGHGGQIPSRSLGFSKKRSRRIHPPPSSLANMVPKGEVAGAAVRMEAGPDLRGDRPPRCSPTHPPEARKAVRYRDASTVREPRLSGGR